jgi:hypothetical protein
MPLLIAFDDTGSDPGILMLANGQAAGPMPAGPIVDGDGTLAITGPFGARLIGTDGQPGWSNGPLAIVAVSSDGTITTLEKSIAGSPSVIGRDDGKAWAWAVQTNSPACGSPTGAAFDIYTDDGSGARRVASASFGAGVTQVSLVAWTAAGIVASGADDCGAFGNSSLAISPAILINPATGAVTGLGSRVGTDCNFGDIADDGTIVCTGLGSTPALRVIASNGTQTNYSMATLTATNSKLPHCIDGVALSADAAFAAVGLGCSNSVTEDIVILDLASGHVAVAGGVDGLTPTLWTPDDLLIASQFGVDKTYSVTPWGLVTLINAKYAAQAAIGT